MTIQIKPIDEAGVSDAALEALLHESYVGVGFTAPDVADKMLSASAVRSRGTVLVAHDDAGISLGTVTWSVRRRQGGGSRHLMSVKCICCVCAAGRARGRSGSCARVGGADPGES